MKLLPNIRNVKEIGIIENLGVNIDFTPEDEDMSPEHGFLEEESKQYVYDQLNSGNSAAWFCAHVSITYKELSADDYLGGCSYGSFKEFTTMETDYYVDMINTCIDEVNRQVESINYGIQRKWNIRKAKNLIAPYELHIVSSKVLQTL